jgi:hypothetical protein
MKATVGTRSNRFSKGKEHPFPANRRRSAGLRLAGQATAYNLSLIGGVRTDNVPHQRRKVEYSSQYRRAGDDFAPLGVLPAEPIAASCGRLGQVGKRGAVLWGCVLQSHQHLAP